MIGMINDQDALEMINASRPTIRFMCSAVMTATATILALLLTMLSFSSNTDQKIKSSHYERLRSIAKLSTGTFITAMIGLLLLSVPFHQAEGAIRWYFDWIYYIMQAYAAILGGALIIIVFMLYSTAKTIILVVHPDIDASPFLASEQDSEQSSDN